MRESPMGSEMLSNESGMSGQAQERGKIKKRDYGNLSPEEVGRFEELKAYFVNHLDAGKSKDPEIQKMVEEYRGLVGKFLTTKQKDSSESTTNQPMDETNMSPEKSDPQAGLFEKFLARSEDEMQGNKTEEPNLELLMKQNVIRPLELAIGELTSSDDIRAFFKQYSTFLGSGSETAGKPRAVNFIIETLGTHPDQAAFERWTHALPELAASSPEN